jgi:hypothetical protein
MVDGRSLLYAYFLPKSNNIITLSAKPQEGKIKYLGRYGVNPESLKNSTDTLPVIIKDAIDQLVFAFAGVTIEVTSEKLPDDRDSFNSEEDYLDAIEGKGNALPDKLRDNIKKQYDLVTLVEVWNEEHKLEFREWGDFSKEKPTLYFRRDEFEVPPENKSGLSTAIYKVGFAYGNNDELWSRIYLTLFSNDCLSRVPFKTEWIKAERTFEILRSIIERIQGYSGKDIKNIKKADLLMR